MDDLAHPQATAEANDAADDLSAGNAVIEAENTDAQNLYPEDQPTVEEAPQEDGDDQGEEGDADADGEPQEDIAAPVGLKAEEKAQFAQLPPEAQRVMTDILERRNLDAQKGVQAAISAQQNAERTAADHVAQAQRDFAQRQAALIQAFQPTPPPIELARENPAEYQYQKALYDEDAAAFAQLAGQLEGLHGQASQHFQQREQEANQERIRGMMTIPEFANDETRTQFVNEIEKFGTGDLGYSVQQLAQMDATDMVALKRAMSWKTDAEKWRDHVKKRNQRPREAAGRFATAPAGNGAARPNGGQTDVLKALYPND